MKKILFLNLATYSSVGGIQKYNSLLINAYSEIALDTKITFDSLSIYDTMSPNISNVKFSNYSGNKFKAAYDFIKIVRKYNTLHLAHINLLPLVLISKILNPKINVLISVHGIEVWKRLTWFKRLCLKFCKILSVSTFTSNKLIELNNVKTDQILYFPNCIEIKENKCNDKKENKIINLLSVSRLDDTEQDKGIDSTIKALQIVLKTVSNIEYTVVGKGNDTKRLKEITKQLQLEKSVKFKGYVKDIDPYYKSCDIFILPSKKEGFGIVYLEAMKYKKPVIACNYGGTTDVVIDKKTGILCEYSNIEQISDAILTLATDKTLSSKYGKNGFLHMKNNFTYSAFKARLEDILLK